MEYMDRCGHKIFSGFCKDCGQNMMERIEELEKKVSSYEAILSAQRAVEGKRC